MTATGAKVAPQDVVVFHDRLKNPPPGPYGTPTWHASAMTRVGSTYEYQFDALNYEDPQNPDFYYPPDGQIVHCIARARYDCSTDPNAYEWSFNPYRFQRPYEDPNDWGTYGWASWYYYLPYEELSHQWFSQQNPSPWDARYSYDHTNLGSLFFPHYNAGIPFEWYALDDGSTYTKGIVQDGGCVASSWAMVLKNLDVKTVVSRPDFRRGPNVTDYLEADPFTVTMASIQRFDVREVQPQRWESVWEGTTNPVSINYVNVSQEFGVASRWRRFAHTHLVRDVLAEDTRLYVEHSSEHPVFGADPYTHYFPAAPAQFYLQVGEEVMKVTSINTTDPNNVFFEVTRGEALAAEFRAQVPDYSGPETIAAPHSADPDQDNGVYEGTEEAKAWAIYQQLVAHSVAGVIVRFSGHSMVFSSSDLTAADFPLAPHFFPDEPWETISAGAMSPVDSEPYSEPSGLVSILTEPTATRYEQGFVVCDPATAHARKVDGGRSGGANVRFDDCYSFEKETRPKRLRQVEHIIVVEKP